MLAPHPAYVPAADASAGPLRRHLLTLLGDQPVRRPKVTCFMPTGDHVEERRASVRISSRRRCLCHPISLKNDESLTPGRLHDVSLDGVAVVVDRPIRPGSFLAIRVDGCEMTLRAQIVRVARHEQTSQWLLGCRVAPRLSEAEMEALL